MAIFFLWWEIFEYWFNGENKNKSGLWLVPILQEIVGINYIQRIFPKVEGCQRIWTTKKLKRSQQKKSAILLLEISLRNSPILWAYVNQNRSLVCSKCSEKCHERRFTVICPTILDISVINLWKEFVIIWDCCWPNITWKVEGNLNNWIALGKKTPGQSWNNSSKFYW